VQFHDGPRKNRIRILPIVNYLFVGGLLRCVNHYYFLTISVRAIGLLMNGVLSYRARKLTEFVHVINTRRHKVLGLIVISTDYSCLVTWIGHVRWRKQLISTFMFTWRHHIEFTSQEIALRSILKFCQLHWGSRMDRFLVGVVWTHFYLIVTHISLVTTSLSSGDSFLFL
jgi:hypothetical protein